jgi:hypothetical protein
MDRGMSLVGSLDRMMERRVSGHGSPPMGPQKAPSLSLSLHSYNSRTGQSCNPIGVDNVTNRNRLGHVVHQSFNGN